MVPESVAYGRFGPHVEGKRAICDTLTLATVPTPSNDARRFISVDTVRDLLRKCRVMIQRTKPLLDSQEHFQFCSRRCHGQERTACYLVP